MPELSLKEAYTVKVPRLALALFVVSPSFAMAQETASENDPRYVAAVTRSAENLKNLPAYSVDVVVDWKTGDGASGSNAYSFRFKKPNLFRVEVKPEPNAEPTLIGVSDGKTLTTFLLSRKLYQQAPMVEPDRAMESSPVLASSLKGSLIDSLMRPNIKDYVLARSRSAKPVGMDDLDGRKVEHFRLIWGRDEEEYWLGPEDQTLPRKLIRVYHFPGQDEAPLTLTTTATLKWSVDAPIDPSVFTLKLPDDAKKVEDIEAALTDSTPDSLLGKPAPRVTLPRLGGGEAEIGKPSGDSVVVVNFWASWCSPSVEALPKIAQLAETLREKGVRVISINVGETPATAAAFLEKQGYKLDVVMDPESLGIEAYGVTALPVLVILDKQGVVRATHSGGGATLMTNVNRDLQAILDGKSPASHSQPR